MLLSADWHFALLRMAVSSVLLSAVMRLAVMCPAVMQLAVLRLTVMRLAVVLASSRRRFCSCGSVGFGVVCLVAAVVRLGSDLSVLELVCVGFGLSVVWQSAVLLLVVM